MMSQGAKIGIIIFIFLVLIGFGTLAFFLLRKGKDDSSPSTPTTPSQPSTQDGDTQSTTSDGDSQSTTSDDDVDKPKPKTFFQNYKLFNDGQDRTGGNIKAYTSVDTTEKCAEYCSTKDDDVCVGFSYSEDDDRCVTKHPNGLKPYTKNDKYNFYRRDKVEDSDGTLYTIEKLGDKPGGDINDEGNLSLQDCASKCSANNDCVGFSYGPGKDADTARCVPKKSDGLKDYDGNHEYQFYTKN